jgi:hypothetical protein
MAFPFLHEGAGPSTNGEPLSKVVIARVVGMGYEHPACGTYISLLTHQLTMSGKFGRIEWPLAYKHRILDARNSLAKMARENNDDPGFLLFVDPDMGPDIEVIQKKEEAKPFFWSSLQFLTDLKAGKIEGFPKGSLGVVGAPAISGPPEFKVNVMISSPDSKGGMRRVTQREATEKKGHIQQCVCIGTGVMLIPLEVFEVLEQPYFDDQYKDDKKTDVWTSQDSYFCLKCNRSGVSVWANWYSWARHYKVVELDRPNEELMRYLNLPENKDTFNVREMVPAPELSGPVKLPDVPGSFEPPTIHHEIQV